MTSGDVSYWATLEVSAFLETFLYHVLYVGFLHDSFEMFFLKVHNATPFVSDYICLSLYNPPPAATI